MPSPLFVYLTSGPYASQFTDLISPRSLESDAAISAILRTKNIAQPSSVLTVDIEKYLMLHGHWGQLKNGTSVACATAIECFRMFPAFDLSEAEVRLMFISVLNGMTEDTVFVPNFNEQDKQAILDMGTQYVSQEDQLRLDCSHYAVSQALDWG